MRDAARPAPLAPVEARSSRRTGMRWSRWGAHALRLSVSREVSRFRRLLRIGIAVSPFRLYASLAPRAAAPAGPTPPPAPAHACRPRQTHMQPRHRWDAIASGSVARGLELVVLDGLVDHDGAQAIATLQCLERIVSRLHALQRLHASGEGGQSGSSPNAMDSPKKLQTTSRGATDVTGVCNGCYIQTTSRGARRCGGAREGGGWRRTCVM